MEKCVICGKEAVGKFAVPLCERHKSIGDWLTDWDEQVIARAGEIGEKLVEKRLESLGV